MILTEKKCRVEKTDYVPAGAILAYKVVECSAADVSQAFNALQGLMSLATDGTYATKGEKLAAISPEAMEVWDSLTATDLADMLNSLLTERASNAQRDRAGIKKADKATGTVKAVKTEVVL